MLAFCTHTMVQDLKKQFPLTNMGINAFNSISSIETSTLSIGLLYEYRSETQASLKLGLDIICWILSCSIMRARCRINHALHKSKSAVIIHLMNNFAAMEKSQSNATSSIRAWQDKKWIDPSRMIATSTTTTTTTTTQSVVKLATI